MSTIRELAAQRTVWFLAAVLCGACVGPPPPTAMRQYLGGTVNVPAAYSISVAGLCKGIGPYSDIHVGTAVVAKDDKSQATGMDTLHRNPAETIRGGPCVFTFRVLLGDSSTLRPSYQLIIGTRPPVSYSTQELKAGNWFVSPELPPPLVGGAQP